MGFIMEYICTVYLFEIINVDAVYCNQTYNCIFCGCGCGGVFFFVGGGEGGGVGSK